MLRGYGKDADIFYEDHLKRAIGEVGFVPIDIKEETNKGNILNIFLKKLETCDAIIADITDANPNVMYEIGQAHSRRLPVILYSREKINSKKEERLPFYLKMDKVENGDASSQSGIEAIINRIKKQLTNTDK